MSTFATRNRAAQQTTVSPPGYTPSGDPPTWGPAVRPSGYVAAPGDVVSPQGPQESNSSIVATVLAIGVVGGLFWWVTSGPKMARSNPTLREYLRESLGKEVGRVLRDYDGTEPTTKWKHGQSGGLIVSSVAVSHDPRILRELKSIARSNEFIFDTVTTKEDRELGLTTLVFTPESAYRFNPTGSGDG